jgi:photosystem II stability/assembly factor-like uncharacterized protein
LKIIDSIGLPLVLGAIACSCGGGASNASGADAGVHGTESDATGSIDSTATTTATGDASGDGGEVQVEAGPHVVTACPSLDAGVGAGGAWVNATPTQVSLDQDAATGAGENYGTAAVLVDPSNTATVYLGTSAQGIYKSTDCGATWTHINTGRNGTTLDNGRQWAMGIDPVDPNVIYANSGYGPETGMFKSTNGGVDFDQMLSPALESNFDEGGFVGGLKIDPTNHAHLLLWPHFTCCDDGGTCTDNCVLESEDSGGTWTRIEVNAITSGEGYGFIIVPDTNSPTNSKHWFLAQGYGGLYETKDGGKTWAAVTSADSYAFPSAYVAGDGNIFVPAAFNVIESTNGGSAWTAIANSPGAYFITGSATTIYEGHGGCTAKADMPFQPFEQASVSDPTKWTTIDTPTTLYGPGDMKYDADHHLLYTSSCLGGLWRGVVQ